MNLPQKSFQQFLRLDLLMGLEGIILLCHGLRLHLAPFPFTCDVSACLLGGGAILWLYKKYPNLLDNKH